MNDILDLVMQLLGGPARQEPTTTWDWQTGTGIGGAQPGPSIGQSGTGPLPEGVDAEQLKNWYRQSPQGLHAWLSEREQAPGQADNVIHWLSQQTRR